MGCNPKPYWYRWVCLLLLWCSCTVWAVADEPQLRLLAYNVRGLPPLLAGDNPKARIETISKKLVAYDLVLLQETFAFAPLIATLTEPEVVYAGPAGRITTNTLLPTLLFGLPCLFIDYCQTPGSSGLLSLVFAPQVESTMLVRQPYETCHGVVSAASDCLASKGFVGVALQVGEFTLHLYNTHLDAGRSAEDRATRDQQLQQLGRAIALHSKNSAVLLMGDLNLRPDDSADQELLQDFMATTGLHDSGLHELQPHQFGFRGVDYLLVRDGTQVVMQLSDMGEAQHFIDVNGQALSDHPALTATVTLTHGQSLSR